MRAIVRFFVRYPIWANAIIFIALIGGAGTYLFKLKKSGFPEREPRNITISVVLPGASPEEMEEGVTIKIEEAIKGLEGIDEVTSTSSENSASINIVSKVGYDLDDLTTEVKNAVDQINSFPVSAEKPIVFKQKSTSIVTWMGIRGEVDLMDLKKAAELVEDDFLNSGVISQVRLSGFPDIEISIEVPEENLTRYGLTFDQVATAVRNNNRDVSGGSIKTEQEEIRIRANAKDFDPALIEEITVKANPDGTKVLLKDIASVQRQFADVPNKIYSNGERTISISVSKLPEEDIEEISEFVDDYVEDFNTKSSNITLFTYFNFNSILSDRLDLMVSNFGIGLILVLTTLGLFLSLRLSFWVALGIPISFFGMFILGDIAGITINMLSLVGMLLVVGILVDDGIVIAENIYTHFQSGKEPEDAAVDGTLEMIPSVFTSVSTTIVAFLPLIFLDNNGFTKEMALVVIFCLGISLIEAFFILPAHLSSRKMLSRRENDGLYSKFRIGMERLINYMRHNLYGNALRFLMNWKWVSFSAPFVFIMIVWGMVQGGIIKWTFFSRPPTDDINMNLTLKPGTRETTVQDYLEKFQEDVWFVNEEIRRERNLEDSVIDRVDLSIGALSDRQTTGSHVGHIRVNLDNLDESGVSSFEVSNRIRKRIGLVPEAEQFTIGATNYWGAPVSVSLKSRSIDDLEVAKEELKASLERLPDLKDVQDNASVGQREIKLELKPLAYFLGLTHQEITKQIRQGFFGEEIQRLQDGTDEVRVWVRYPEDDRINVAQLESMKIRMPDGAQYPLAELADYELERGVIKINHFNGKREIRVEAEMADVKTPVPPIIEKVQKEILPPLLAKYPGMEYTFEGQSSRRQKEFESFWAVFAPIFIVMIMLITLNFRSVYQTMLIFFLLPLGWACGIFGHLFHDALVSMTSFQGLLALSGVVINDAVVMLDKFNRNLRDGIKIREAAYQAGIARFRAILLTSLTTVAGLFPLILETSFQAQFLIPMAIALAYGVLFGTFFILFFFPVMMLCFNDIKVYITWLIRMILNAFSTENLRDLKPAKEDVEPAIIEGKRLAQV
ncbi:MAG: efflux RND transporter permease subunit [Cyclobacteriaceae bacterium]